MEKLYTCSCGKEFRSSNALNSHKSYCKECMIKKYGSWEAYQVHKNRNSFLRVAKIRETAANKQHAKQIAQEQALQKWISEQHRCEHCNKIMTEYYGSGRYCSRRCANSKQHSEATKEKIKVSAKIASPAKATRTKNIKKYYENPSKCCICGTIIDYDKKNNKTCSKKCFHKLLKVVCNHEPNNSPRPQFKYGTYKGVACDSSWELAFIVYHFDRSINITRNTQYFTYEYENGQHRFYPDFKLENTYYEIKGYWTDQETAKIRSFPNELKLIVLDLNEIQPYIKYCEEKYGKDFTAVLYEKDKPSYLDRA